ncbi:hypothetical protein Nepgr_010594 [Nepenthes gracilis]|uniref:La-related protein 6B n=1 Tax=Nepenthes gracilis TaxID=150966 RepID=A0AAD3SD81_NEPGR|nr:hypothetical protein Nepgr_010594 [Nepenthes gracilis]
MADQSSDAPSDSSTPSTALPGSSTSPPPASGSEPALARNVSFSKLNAQAPEFVPMKTQSTPAVAPRIAIAPPSPSTPQTVSGMVHVYGAPNSPSNVPIQAMVVQNHHHHPHMHNQQHHVHYHHHPQHPHHHQKIHQFYGGGEQDAVVQGQQLQYDKDHGNTVARNGLSEEATQKILNQVEYYFSDVNLATTDHLIRFINKDPEGYVPISVVASFKKIKALISNNSQLAVVLRNSTKLVVSDDGKKVKRVHPLTDMEELQARIIVAENLPEDHCHQNLMKVFSSVGSVKSIRTCQPQASNNGASSASRSSKGENMLHSNKLHAFVEYESIELAEKAVVELNDEGDWRNGLRVRLLLKRMSKSVQARGKKAGNEGEGTCEDDDTSTSEQNQNDKQAEDTFGPYDVYSQEHLGEEQVGEKEGGQKKGRNRGRGKGRGRGHQHQANRGTNVGPPTSNQANSEQLKHPPPGPRMPDGTRGFSMGRGKPVAVNTA